MEDRRWLSLSIIEQRTRASKASSKQLQTNSSIPYLKKKAQNKTTRTIAMATTYAAYANVMHGAQAQPEQSARSSVSSSTSSTAAAARKSRWQRFVDELKPIDEPQTPISIYGPLVFQKKAKKESQGAKQESPSSSRRASHIYAEFKNKVGGEKVHFYG